MPVQVNFLPESSQFKYDPSDLSQIYVFSPNAQPPQYLPVPAPNQEYTTGLSLWKHRAIHALARQQAAQVDIVQLGQAKRQLQEIVNNAQQRQKTSMRPSRKRWGKSDPASRLPSVLVPGPAVLRPPIETTAPPRVIPSVGLPEADWEVAA